jgi:hypothetical protein
MAAATCAVVHNWKTNTTVYTFSEEIYFDLISEPGEGTKLEKGGTVATDLTKYFAIYKPALNSTYAAPDAEGAGINLYTDVTLKAVIFAKDGKSLTVTYNEEFAFVDVTAFGYIVYPILYKAYTKAANTDSSTNHIQACFASPTIVPITNITAWNTKVALSTALAIRTQDGALYTPTKKNEKCVLLLFNGDSSNPETVTFYDGDHVQSIGSTTAVTLDKSTNGAIQLETGKYLHVAQGSLFEGKIYFTGTSDVTVLAIETA